MKKVLIIGTTNIYGGVGHIMFELCNSMNKEEVSFDFLYYQDATLKEKEMIHALGGEFYLVPRYSKKPIAFYKVLREFYKEHHYDVIHVHASTAMLILYTFPVWNDGNVHIVYQSHVREIAGKSNYLLHTILRKKVNKCAKCRLAVSKDAFDFMYGFESGQEPIILNNGIKVTDFLFHEEIRKKQRELLGIGKKYVIGHVGRFSKAKNHTFLVDVFDELCKRNENYVLLLIGNGEDEIEVRDKVKNLQLTEKVIFYGTSENVGE